MPKPIRFVFTVWSSKRDRNGNCYHFAQIRSTTTGKAFAWHTHSASNAQRELCRALGVSYLEWDTLHYTENTVGERELGRIAKAHGDGCADPTPATITELES
jgi:hypothetical protein